MRILIISTNVVKWGGSEDLWRNVALKSLEKGHEVMISVFMHNPLHDKILDLEKKGASIHKRPFPSYYTEQRFSGRLLAEVKLRLRVDQTSLDWIKVKSFKPESVLISSGETFDYIISKESFLIGYCLKYKIPYYLISQFNWEHDMNISMQFRKSHQELTHKSSGHFFVSHRNYKNAEMHISSTINNVRIINNPIKLNLKHSIPYPEGNVLKLAMVARYQTYIKGQDLLLQALSSKVFKNVPFQLSLYGSEGNEGPHIENLIHHYGLSDKVFLKGGTKDIESVWRNNQLCVLTSRAEGTPLSLMEAMYCGRTALVTNAGDSALWVGERGYIAECNTVESLTAALLKAFNDSQNWKSLGLECRDVIDRNMDFKQDEQIAEVLVGERVISNAGKDPDVYLKKLKML